MLDQYDSLGQDIGLVLTITGRSKNAQLHTVVEYLVQTWSEHTLDLLDAIRAALSIRAGKLYRSMYLPVY